MVSQQESEGYSLEAKYSSHRDLAVLFADTLVKLFGAVTRSSEPIKKHCLKTWIAYVLYRTDVPNPTVFHAIHLVKRLSRSFETSPNANVPPFFHERIFLSSLVLASAYSLDNSYANSSWSIASKGIFSVGEIDEMEMELFRCLSFSLRQEGEDLDSILRAEEKAWSQGLLEKHVREHRAVSESHRRLIW
ncbi:hypothetical protein BT69DRAFT_1347491 [Atractiella rhizophila]|nr:hypothetical protein BT69DRAFT_1347491 [Atractiella rhizophila]